MCYWAALLHVPVTGCRLHGSWDGLASSHLATLERCPSWPFSTEAYTETLQPPSSAHSFIKAQQPQNTLTVTLLDALRINTHTLTPRINICICPLVESHSPTQTLSKLSQRHTVTFVQDAYIALTLSRHISYKMLLDGRNSLQSRFKLMNSSLFRDATFMPSPTTHSKEIISKQA